MRDENEHAGDDNGRQRRSWSFLRQAFRDGERSDLGWLAMPEGHRALSDAHRANDLVLKHFHRPLDLVTLPFAPCDDSTVLRGISDVPPVQSGRGGEAKVWISPRRNELIADVRVGTADVGATTLATWAWKALLEEAARGVYSDGVLSLRPKRGRDVDLTAELRCYLPRESDC